MAGGRYAQAIGKNGEILALSVLAGRGVRIPERFGPAVQMSLVRGVKGAYHIIPGDPVSGDINGILENGIRVIAEVKTVYDRNLRWSDLRKGQPEKLDMNKQYNGISLLVWVSGEGVFVMDWQYPNDDFGPGHGLTIAQARLLDVMDVNQLVK